MNDWLEHSGYCPYCGERITLLIDCSEQEQAYIEDCEVCCRPIQVSVALLPHGEISVTLKHENEI